jgi:adenosylcobinamide-phosphate synthase
VALETLQSLALWPWASHAAMIYSHILRPNPWILGVAVLLDLLLGDPVYPLHPVRVMGWTLAKIEAALRAMKFDGYFGGILLFLLLAVIWIGGWSALVAFAARHNHIAALVVEAFIVYSMIALRDLVKHCWNVEAAASRNDLEGARQAISRLVGRDIERMDIAACRRAAIESASENLTDGFVSVIFWYAVAGIPGIVLFKIASTMDSMVGYKTPRYLKFGWCGARLDDVMNWLPARITWLLISAVAVFIPKCSATKALRIGWQQHALVPGPNAGWSEAATAGAIQRKLIGPIWRNGNLVTELWLGNAADPPAAEKADVMRALTLVTITGLSITAIAVAIIWRLSP